MKSMMLAVAAMVLMLTACNKNDDPTNNPTNDPTNRPGSGQEALSVVGTWIVDVTQSTMHEEETSNGETSIEDYTLLEEGMVECQLVFRSNGQMSMTTVYEEDGERESYTDTYGYEVDGNTMTWDGQETLTITHLDAHSMILDESASNEYSDGTYSWSMHLVCNKQ